MTAMFLAQTRRDQLAESLYTIVNARYPSKSIILTSNRAITDWHAIFPGPAMANALVGRLAHNARKILIKGESYRKKLAPQSRNVDSKKSVK
jgi:DNA replication protein DnaC